MGLYQGQNIWKKSGVLSTILLSKYILLHGTDNNKRRRYGLAVPPSLIYLISFSELLELPLSMISIVDPIVVIWIIYPVVACSSW